MCGIVGLRQLETVPPGVMERACATIRHRGPDHWGEHRDRNTAIAMTRLSVIDLATGNQPIYGADGQVAIVFNGEIYNFRELRGQLGGHLFRTQSDTEVILAGYLAWGVDVFARLNGMFAVAIHDRRSGELILARDSMGIKPLYVGVEAGRLAFSSELKTFPAMGWANRIDPQAVLQFLASGYVFRPHSALRGVEQVEPGVALIVGPDLAVHRYRFAALPPARFKTGLSVEQWSQRIEASLEAAVLRQMVADVPVGLLLSAGLDSMAILALLLRNGYGGNLATYTVGFENRSFSEAEDVRAVTSKLGVVNHSLLLTCQDVADGFDGLCGTIDNLEILPTAIAIRAVSALAGSHGKVVLSGVGGDELFMGYPTHRATQIRRMLGPAGRLLRLAAWLPGLLPASSGYLSLSEKLERFLSAGAHPVDLAHVRWRHIFTDAELPRLTESQSIERIMQPQLAAFAEADRAGYRGMDRCMYVDLRTWMIDYCLSLWDKAGMASSLEIRVPFLDLDFVADVLSMPQSVRARRPGKKQFFRSMATRFLPQEILSMPKHGFQVPLREWMRTTLRPMMMERTAALPADRFDQGEISRLWRDHVDGRRDNSLRLWSLAALSTWAAAHRLQWD